MIFRCGRCGTRFLQLKLVLPDFGKVLALDGKGIETHARGRKVEEGEQKEEDGRRDTDAECGVKTYCGQREDGTLWQKVKSWFGYKLQLIVDANYELLLAFKVKKASEAEMPKAHDLLDEIEECHPDILKRCVYLDADQGYDDGKLITRIPLSGPTLWLRVQRLL
ncbi:MAG: transposase [Deltaproteobacteria bacterium]|nr:transposase [Deltaproteobacteria bacterium]